MCTEAPRCAVRAVTVHAQCAPINRLVSTMCTPCTPFLRVVRGCVRARTRAPAGAGARVGTGVHMVPSVTA